MSLHVPEFMRRHESGGGAPPPVAKKIYTPRELINVNMRALADIEGSTDILLDRDMLNLPRVDLETLLKESAPELPPVTLKKKFNPTIREIIAKEEAAMRVQAPKVMKSEDYIEEFQDAETKTTFQGHLVQLEDALSPTLNAVASTNELEGLSKTEIQKIRLDTEQSLKEQYIYRALVQIVPFETDKDLSEVDKKITVELRATRILDEMKEHGVDSVVAFRKAVMKIEKAKNAREMNYIVETEHIGEAIQNERLRLRFDHSIQMRNDYFATSTKEFEQGKKDEPNVQKADKYEKMFKEAWDYFQYATPKDMNGRHSWLPKRTLQLIHFARKNLHLFNKEVARSEDLMRTFWHSRVRPEAMHEYMVKEAPHEEMKAIDTLFNRYHERISDRFLNSEAAGFELKEAIRIPEKVEPSVMVFQTMKSLIRQHQPKNQNEVLFTLMIGEQQMRKVKVQYNELWSNEQIEKAIEAGLAQSSIVAIVDSESKQPLTRKQRAEISYTGYSPDRVEDKAYRDVYGYGKEKKLNGDYLIQIKGWQRGAYDHNHVDQYSPESLFAVDSHKAAVLLDMDPISTQAGTAQVTIRYNHTHIDGIQAEHHAERQFQTIRDLVEKPTLKGSARILTGAVMMPKSDSDPGVYPLMEGRATYIDTESPPKKMELGGMKFSPTDLNLITLMMANDIDYVHQLHAEQEKKGMFYTRNADRFDNVQPAMVSRNHLIQEYKKWLAGQPFDEVAVREWLVQTRAAGDRSKKGRSDLAVLAAAPGPLHEDSLYLFGLKFTQGARLMRDTQCTFSPLARKALVNREHQEFSTAHSNSSAPDTIDLTKPYKSMGIIGYLPDNNGKTNVYTVRRLPSQSQVEFSKAVKRDLVAQSTPSMQTEALKEFTRVIQAWDELLKGNINLDTYRGVTKSVLENLYDPEVCGEDQLATWGIRDTDTFQAYLNTTLENAAKNTFNKKNLTTARNNIEAFFIAAGATVEEIEKKG